jgi:uncharacterized protein YutE (UPF0331/DUF86 family)
MNHHVVFTRFNEMNENLKILEEFKAISFAEFAGDPKIYKLAERCLQLCIECIIDIAHYLIAQNQWEQPLNTKEAILALGDHNVLPELFADSIAGLAGFRNILVHGYTRIDRAIVYDNLKKLDDFRDFQKYILDYLDKQAPPQKSTTSNPS